MKRIIIVVLAIVSWACSSSSSDSIRLFNNMQYKLMNNEILVRKDEVLSDQFSRFVDDLEFQVPLYKCTEGFGYTIFLGLPYKGSVRQIAKNRLRQGGEVKDILTDTSHFYYAKEVGRRDDIYEYAVEENGNTLYLVAVVDNTKGLDSLFSYLSIKDRVYVQE